MWPSTLKLWILIRAIRMFGIITIQTKAYFHKFPKDPLATKLVVRVFFSSFLMKVLMKVMYYVALLW